MLITNEFREAVENNKMTRVRIMLKDSMLVDPTMKQFDGMLDFAKSNISNLFDEHDEEVLKYDHSDWNESYLNNQMVVVVSNFSKERVELLRNMVKYIYRDKIEKINVANQYQSNLTRKQVGVGMTVAGAAVTVAGICIHQGLIVVGGVVVAAVGVGLIVTDKEE